MSGQASGLLAGQVAIVTGGGKNIGRAIALRLAAQGADVAVVGKHDEAALQDTADAIRQLGRRASAIRADVADEADVARLIDVIVQELGAPQILINNAAVRRQVPLAEMSYDEWRAINGIILDGAFLCARAALPHMQQCGGGAIINLGGLSSHIGGRNRAHVIAAKAGVVGLTRALAVDLSEFNIRVNCVAPGKIQTTRGASAGAPPQHPGGDTPLIAAAGEVEDIAAMVAFLAGPEAKYITGQTVHVNGGLYLT